MDLILMTNYSFKRQCEINFKNYFLQPRLLSECHSFILFNPCVKVKSWACQYFSVSHKTLSASSPSLTRTCSISSTCKYPVLHVADLQTSRRWLATPHLILLVLMSLLWIRSLSLKPLAEPMYCLLQHLHAIR